MSLEPNAYVSASSYASRRGDVGPGGTSRGGIPRPGATAEMASAANLVIYDPRDDAHRRAESSAPSQMPGARSKRCRHNQENKYVVVAACELSYHLIDKRLVIIDPQFRPRLGQ